jgi:hypothetical protein
MRRAGQTIFLVDPVQGSVPKRKVSDWERDRRCQPGVLPRDLR